MGLLKVSANYAGDLPYLPVSKNSSSMFLKLIVPLKLKWFFSFLLKLSCIDILSSLSKAIESLHKFCAVSFYYWNSKLVFNIA